MLDGLGGGDQTRVDRGLPSDSSVMLLPPSMIPRMASQASRRLAEDLEDLGEPLDMGFGSSRWVSKAFFRPRVVCLSRKRDIVLTLNK